MTTYCSGKLEFLILFAFVWDFIRFFTAFVYFENFYSYSNSSVEDGVWTAVFLVLSVLMASLGGKMESSHILYRARSDLLVMSLVREISSSQFILHKTFKLRRQPMFRSISGMYFLNISKNNSFKKMNNTGLCSYSFPKEFRKTLCCYKNRINIFFELLHRLQFSGPLSSF